MAIVNHLSVEIRSCGAALPEYPVPAEEQIDPTLGRRATQHSTKYIEAISGAPYEITCHVAKGFQFGKAEYLSFRVYIDGKYSTAEHAKKENYLSDKHFSKTRRGFKASVDGVWKSSHSAGARLSPVQ